MTIEIGFWKLEDSPTPVAFEPMESEGQLEDVLAHNIGVADPNLLLIGRQVSTVHGKFIDLLAIDADGKLVVLELKKNRTPREVVAQLRAWPRARLGGRPEVRLHICRRWGVVLPDAEHSGARSPHLGQCTRERICGGWRCGGDGRSFRSIPCPRSERRLCDHQF